MFEGGGEKHYKSEKKMSRRSVRKETPSPLHDARGWWPLRCVQIPEIDHRGAPNSLYCFSFLFCENNVYWTVNGGILVKQNAVGGFSVRKNISENGLAKYRDV